MSLQLWLAYLLALTLLSLAPAAMVMFLTATILPTVP